VIDDNDNKNDDDDDYVIRFSVSLMVAYQQNILLPLRGGIIITLVCWLVGLLVC